MSRALVSIDPGVTGALAVFNQDTQQLEHLGDLRVIRDMSTGWIDAEHTLSVLFNHLQGRQSTVIIERVHAMPKNGSQGAFSQGLTFGSLLATLQIARCRIEMVSPVTWKTQSGLTIRTRKLSDRERKELALDKARLLFPDADLERQKDHNRAEALLIGHWYMTHKLARSVA